MPSRVPPERTTADVREPVVAFLIGMRINRIRSIRGWLPVYRAMRPMTKELRADPSLGMLSRQVFRSGRTFLVLTYWRSFDALEAYAQGSLHRPAWTAFYQRSRQAAGSVGVYHETYMVAPGSVEAIYVDMPADFGLGGAVGRVPATGSLQTARQRRDRDVEQAA
ncbi:MAG: DUF4188 domain-containing protein [Chloroflexota bacterium]